MPNIKISNEIQREELLNLGAKNNIDVPEFTISPLSDDLKTDKNQVSSPKYKLYKFNNEIFANVKIGTNQNQDLLNKISTINLTTDDENENNCDIHLTYLDNNSNAKFNSVIGMDIHSAKKIMSAIRNENIQLKINNKIVAKRPTTTQINSIQEKLKINENAKETLALNNAKKDIKQEIPTKIIPKDVQTNLTQINQDNTNKQVITKEQKNEKEIVLNELTPKFISEHKNEIKKFIINHNNSTLAPNIVFNKKANHKILVNKPLNIYKYQNEYYLEGSTYNEQTKKFNSSIQKLVFFAPREEENTNQKLRKCTFHTINNKNQKSSNLVHVCKLDSLLSVYEDIYKTKYQSPNSSIKLGFKMEDALKDIKVLEFINKQPDNLSQDELNESIYNHYNKVVKKEVENSKEIQQNKEENRYKGQILASNLGISPEDDNNTLDSTVSIDESKFQVKDLSDFENKDNQETDNFENKNQEIKQIDNKIQNDINDNDDNETSSTDNLQPNEQKPNNNLQTAPTYEQKTQDAPEIYNNIVHDDKIFSPESEIEDLKKVNNNNADKKANQPQNTTSNNPAITQPNETLAQNEINTPPQTTAEQQKEKNKEATPPPEQKPEKSDAKTEKPEEKKHSYNLWKSPFKDLTLMALKAGAIFLMVGAFLGAFAPFMLPISLICGVAIFVYGDDVMNYMEKGIKGIAKLFGKTSKHIQQTKQKKQEIYKTAEFDKKGHYIHELERKKLLGQRLTKEEKQEYKEEKQAKRYRWKMHKKYERRQKAIDRKPDNKALGIKDGEKVQSYVKSVRPNIVLNKHGNKQITIDPKAKTKDDKIALFSAGYDEVYKPKNTTPLSKETITKMKLGLLPRKPTKKPIQIDKEREL